MYRSMMTSKQGILVFRTFPLPGRIRYSGQLSRCQSSLASRTPLKAQPGTSVEDANQNRYPLSRVSTKNLIRNILLGKALSSPILFKYGVACLSKIANSESALLDPDRNILLRALIKPTIYDHFCAGTNKLEVKRTTDQLKGMGFKGVILIYSREIPAMPIEQLHELEPLDNDPDIEIWRDGNIKTLDMVQEGDYVGIKFTGAGPRVAQALSQNQDPPPQLLSAMETICTRAAAQNSRLWIDAEQQIYQPTINRWTLDLMRQYNTHQALISTTLQAYLKSAPATLTNMLQQSRSQNFILGIKLVRGAYINSETRSLIHDTKTQTDKCYDTIISSLLTKSHPDIPKPHFPPVELFLAGHNANSITKAHDLHKSLTETKQILRFGQLLGMADDVSCGLLAARKAEKGKDMAQVYKCMNWGGVKECLHYLVRRAVENKSAATRMQRTNDAMLGELRRRIGF